MHVVLVGDADDNPPADEVSDRAFAEHRLTRITNPMQHHTKSVPKQPITHCQTSKIGSPEGLRYAGFAGFAFPQAAA